MVLQKDYREIPINCSSSVTFAVSAHCTVSWRGLLTAPYINIRFWVFLKKKKGKSKKIFSQHNLMRHSVKGTKWITKCRVGSWVDGCKMKSVRLQHPSVAWGGGQCGRVTVLDNKPALDSAVVLYGEWERERGRTKVVPPQACLNRQDLHVGFWAWAPGQGGGGCK